MRRRGKDADSRGPVLPLFPVLAVMLSTVGVLCLLLLVVTRQALLADGRRQQLRELRAQVTLLERELENRRRALAGARHVVEELGATLRDLEKQAANLRSELDSARQRLRDQLQERETLLAAATSLRAQRAERSAVREDTPPPGWLVTLAPSPHGDRRSPVFFECRRDRVRLQPAELDLFEEDFVPGPAGTSAFQLFVRAVVGRLEAQGVLRPYPVLIVRPDGIAAFYAAMQQLDSVKVPFGYELIESEKALIYPDLALSQGELASLLESARTTARTPIATGAGDSGLPGTPNGGATYGPPGKPELVQTRERGASSGDPGPQKTFVPSSSGSPRTALDETEEGRAPPNLAPGSPPASSSEPRLLVLNPPKAGVWYRDVYAVVTAENLSVLPRVSIFPAPISSDQELNELLKTLVALTHVDSNLVVLEVRPRLYCLVTPAGIQNYFRLRWQLARAGVATQPIVVAENDVLALESALAYLRLLPGSPSVADTGDRGVRDDGPKF